jgi:UDP-N-acetylglucosamine 2-epimerase (non-hydrolysing)
MSGIARTLQTLLHQHPEVHIIFPVHLNPRVRAEFLPVLSSEDRCHLLDPLPYDQFVLLMKACTLILTDSGGIQEEAPSLGKPVLVMRRETERQEAVEAGTAIMVGEDPATILKGIADVLARGLRGSQHPPANPFGDGHASEKIADAILEMLPSVAGRSS